MMRARALKVILLLVGLLYIAGSVPLVLALLGRWDINTGDQMILGIYLPLGVFLLLALRNPAANRTLIACVAWANLAHVGVMAIQTLQRTNVFGYAGLTVMALISVALLGLLPWRRQAATAAAAQPLPLTEGLEHAI